MADISNFLGGRWLRHSNLAQPWQLCTIAKADQQTVGQGQQAELKECLEFAEFPGKPLALNVTNLGRVAQLYGTDDALWVNRQLLLYRSATTYQGQTTLCVRVCGPQQAPPDTVCDLQGNAVAYVPQAPQPAAPQQPVAPQAAAPAAPVQAPVQPPAAVQQPAQPQPVQPVQPPAAAAPAQAAPWEADDNSPPPV